MQIFERHQDLSKKYLSLVYTESLKLLDVVEQFTTRAQIKHEAVVVLGAKRILQLHDEGVLQFAQDVSF